MSSISFGRNEYVGASTGAYLSGDDLSLRLAVDDKKLRESGGVPNDGYERAFALVPTRDGGWKRVDLKFEGTGFDRGGSSHDTHALRLDNIVDQGFSLDRVVDEGIAFGLEISGPHGADPKTVWLQHQGDNYKPISY